MKTVLLLLGIGILIAGIIYVTIQIQDTSKPSGILQSRASENPTNAPTPTDVFLAANQVSPTVNPTQFPSPTFGNPYFNSTLMTSPTVALSPTTAAQVTALPKAGVETTFLPLLILVSATLVFSAFLF